MRKLTQQELREKIKTLPPDLTDAVFSPDVTEVLLSIAKKYGLMVDKIGELSSATNHVMLGVLHPKEYISTLEEVLAVDRETAKKIAGEVNAEIFAKIRESLKKVHGISEQLPSISSPKPVDQPLAKPKIPFSDLKPVAPASLEREVEGILKTTESAKPKIEPKKLWPPAHLAEMMQGTDKQGTVTTEASLPQDSAQSKPALDVKIRTVEEAPETPRTSPFGSKMQDGIFRSPPSEERKVTEEKPTVPRYGFPDPYREQLL